MAEDGKVVYKVKADSKDAVSEAQTAGEKMGSALKGAAAGIGKAFVASAAAATAAAAAIAVSVGKASIQSYADYEQLAGGVETLFKDSANVVKGYADAAYKTAGMSANAYMETVTSFSASLLQSLGGDTAAAAEAANSAVVDMSDNANKMGTSIESIQYAYQGFAKQNYTMLDNLKLGYGGTKEEMQRLLEDAQKLSGQKYDISSLNDVYEAVHVVQTELGITGTTAKEASETISGSASAMKSSWGNLMTAFSSDGWDIDVYLENFIDSVITFGENLVPRILSLAPNLIYGIAELATALIPYVMESAQTILQQIIDALIAGVPQLFEIATQIVQMLVDGISSNLGNIADVAAELLLSFVDMIVSMLPQIITLATDLVLTLAGALINNIDQIIESGLELLLALIQGLVENFPKLVDATFVLIEKLIGAIINNLPKIIEMGIKIVLSLVAGLLQAIPRLALAVPKLIASIISAFTNTNWSSLGKNIIDGIGKGISDGWQWLVDSVSNLASSLFNTAKRALGIKSPSKKFKYIGEMSMEGTKKGFEDEAPDLNRTVSTLYSSAATAAHGSLQKNSGFLGANMRENVEKNISFSMSATATTPNQSIEVPVYLNGREIARATAWNMGEQLAWEEL